MTTPPLRQGEAIADYMQRYEAQELLRFITCGSVDDGKSTLIGRLLHDTGRIHEDHLAALERDSRTHGTTGGGLDLALVVDGLKAEREQGITIDVAWRYFATARRSFIIADCPGHEQYTRNMATGASHCALAISLIDARHGVTTQTRRHAFIASLLGIRHVVAAVNKMDLVDWSEARFRAIESEFQAYCGRLGIPDPVAVPISAREGDNVVHRSAHTPWYSGVPVLELLETLPIPQPDSDGPLRIPVQGALRPNLDFRGFTGTVERGTVKPGDPVKVLPSGRTSRVRRIARPPEEGGDAPVASAGEAVVLCLEDETDCSRGDMIVGIGREPATLRRIECDIVWMLEDPLVPGRPCLVRVGTRTVPCTLRQVRWIVDVDTLATSPGDAVRMNEIARVELDTEDAIVADAYRASRTTGAAVLIDRMTNATAAACMVRLPDEPQERRAHWETEAASTLERAGERPSSVSAAERAARWRQSPATLLIYGAPRTGKTSLAHAVERILFDAGHAAVVIDGQALRRGLSRDLSFSDEDRSENVRRAAEIARMLNDQGFIVILAMGAPVAAARARAAALVGEGRWVETESSGADAGALAQALIARGPEPQPDAH
jgi:bifunctional enzyme CysN/CysC